MKWFTWHTWQNCLWERQKWHIWFAWYPITIKIHQPEGIKEKIWLENIMRCGKYHCFYDDSYWTWEYEKLDLYKLKMTLPKIKPIQPTQYQQ